MDDALYKTDYTGKFRGTAAERRPIPTKAHQEGYLHVDSSHRNYSKVPVGTIYRLGPAEAAVVKDRAQKMQNTMLQYSDSQKSLQDMATSGARDPRKLVSETDYGRGKLLDELDGRAADATIYASRGAADAGPHGNTSAYRDQYRGRRGRPKSSDIPETERYLGYYSRRRCYAEPRSFGGAC
jgi:hypothetical protein